MKDYKNFVKTFLLNNRNYIYLSFLFLIAFLLIAIFLKVDENLKQEIIKGAIEHIKSVNSTNSFYLSWNIFKNNLLIWLLIFVSWFFLSFLWILILFANSLVSVWVFKIWVQKMWILKSLLAILPHGVFEIFAILLCLSLAFKISHLLLKKAWNFKKYKIKDEILKTFKFFLIFVVPLLFFAAIIEAFVTNFIVNFLL